MIEAKASVIEALKRPALYVVATPIGHLGDISLRALHILRHVDAIAAEDTRHSKHLLDHYGIKNTLFSVHDHNEADRIEFVLNELLAGKAIALISDAGTPLISDPGYKLVHALRKANQTVIPIPGPSAMIAALSVAGLPTDRFTFIGFLPAKSGARQTVLKTWLKNSETLVCYESTHRILECLKDMLLVFGETRPIVLAKELTKPYEAVCHGFIPDILTWLQEDPKHQNGEFVLMVQGAASDDTQDLNKLDELLQLLLAELPLKTAVKLATSYTGVSKNQVYTRALALGDRSV